MTPEQHLEAALCPAGKKLALNVNWAALLAFIQKILPLIPGLLATNGEAKAS